MSTVILSVLLFGAVLLASLLFLFWLSPAALHGDPRASVASERQYLSVESPKKPLPLGTIEDPAEVELSVVVPAYNEVKRLPGMLEEALDHLRKHYKQGQYEILIVDDGSKDDTAKVALDFAKQHADNGGKNIRVVKLAKNRGKGGAVRHGMLHARGHRILFVDADGASTFADLEILEKHMKDLCSSSEDKNDDKKVANGRAVHDTRGIVLGSRAHMVNSEAVVKRSKLRNILMRSFHLYLSVLGISHIKDTQCGFKLFTRSAARAIFPSMHVEGWIFDIEILIIAGLLGDVKVEEVPIRWHEVDGSKMDLLKDSLQMATDLLVIRGSYLLGRWRVKPTK